MTKPPRCPNFHQTPDANPGVAKVAEVLVSNRIVSYSIIV